MKSRFKTLTEKNIVSLTLIVVICVISLMVLMLVMMHGNVKRTENVDLMENARGHCETAINDFSRASDYLTQEVWQYSLDGRWQHVKNYWNEANNTRRRDKAIETLLHADLTAPEKTHALRAKYYSDQLMTGEIWSMKMLASANNVPEEQMPEKLKNYKLSKNDLSLSAAEKKDKVRSYLFGTTYSTEKQNIHSMVYSFNNDLSERLGDAAKNTMDSNRKANLIADVLMALIIILIFLIIIIYMRMMGEKNRNLGAALDKATAANEAKSYFTSRMSHEIRTPMNAVLGYLTLADDADNDDAVRENVRKSRTAAVNLMNIVNDVLDYSAIENRKIQLVSEPFSVTDVIREMQIVYSSIAEKKGVTFNVDHADIRHDTLIGDRVHLTQILTNLLSNAIKFTPAGGSVSFSVSQKTDSSDDDTAEMTYIVSDTGIGMSEEFIPHVFEAYEQQDASISNRYGGTGLGMFIVKSLTELMNGSVEVESRQNEGSIFTVRFSDLIGPDGAQTKSSFSDGSAVISEREKLSQIHILVVEDNKMNSEIAQAILTKMGATVEPVFNGQEGVEAFEKAAPGTYDAILMDISMPVMDGYEAARRIRASERDDAAQIPIIAMTANAFSTDVEKALAAGMDAHVSKPIDVDLMADTICRLTDSRKKQ